MLCVKVCGLVHLGMCLGPPLCAFVLSNLLKISSDAQSWL